MTTRIGVVLLNNEEKDVIKEVTKFETKGRSFYTEKDAVQFREGLVEAFIRGLPGFTDIPASKRVVFCSRILDKRKELLDLLDY